MTSYTKCPLWDRCGGCQLMDLDYEDQLEEKQRFVEDNLSGYGPVAPILGMDNPVHFRTKVQAAFGYEWHGSRVISGIYQAGTHHIVPIRDCLVEDEDCQQVIATVRTLMNNFRIAPYDEDLDIGYIRHVLVKKASYTGQIMVVLVCGAYPFPHKDDFINLLRQRNPKIKTILLNLNNEKTSMVLSDEPERVLFGPGFIEERISGLWFRVSAKSFFQVNPQQTEVLFDVAMKMARITPTDRVIDAYCGTGTIGMIAASKGAKEVLGIELNADAVRDAQANKERNKLENIQFLQDDASSALKELAAQNAECDVLFLDPPRQGSDERFLASAIKLSPHSIVYISCNVNTLARDLNYLERFSDYQVVGIQPVDMFPHTTHVETVVLMSRVDGK
ncbi:MAG: 23S rRNA (uracil(1939)-C(5))-methyltransferase RlmD [Sphaerochaeta sp.]|jgi:23S rRNA (uracil1939-C5)-methyltransferase|nr:23S rRNA (uracil(1939)-C(5))-methyltransferase RlmD [Sphaerochaeta sp.]